ncbi:Calcium-binding protein [Nostoc sp. DSM 114161]|uniref:beta strand repeat-containing protein n=1 Tax=Nostoc sp. DSM 114161 TaxID=3440143 RepID=UPI0040463F00
MSNIIGTNANDTLYGTSDADTINGKAGNDVINGQGGKDTLTGGGGKDTFVYDNYFIYSTDETDIITDFGGVGKGTNPTASVIAEVDTIQFYGEGLTARNMVLTQNGTNLEITFEGGVLAPITKKVILQNFKLEDLDNLKASGSRPAIGNIIFDGQTTITDSFNVLDANSTDTSIGIKNTVTFLNDLDNNITGLDNSDDVINGQGGNDKIDGLSGNDLLRGGTGNDTLIGGLGNDTLVEVTGNNSLVGGAGDDTLKVDSSTGNNTLNGGAGNDILSAEGSQGNNLLFGGDGNDILDASYLSSDYGYSYIATLGNNTLYGGAGDDTLAAVTSKGNRFLSGDDGNDRLSVSGFDAYRSYYSFSSSGDNTLNGGAGNDTLLAEYSTGNNLLSGGDGNDLLSVSGYVIGTSAGDFYDPTSGNNTLNGGAGNDTLLAEYSTGNNLLSGGDGNDSFYLNTLPADTLAIQTVDGGKDDDLLSVDGSIASQGITSTYNATANTGVITAGKYQVNYKNIERLNILGTEFNDNILGSNGNDTLSTGNGGKDTIDGGKGDDVVSADYSNATAKITTTFNTTTNTGSITAGTYQVSYKNIERLNISGTAYDDKIVGNNGNDTLSTGGAGKDTIDGGQGDDVLSVNYYSDTTGITTTYNATTNTGVITAGNNRVSYKNIERLNIFGTAFDDKIVGNNGNDTLFGGYDGNDTIIGGAGNDVLKGGKGNDTLTGGSGNDKFVYDLLESYYDIGTDIITDFDASLDTLEFIDNSSFRLFSAQNLQLTKNGNNLEITFEDLSNNNTRKVILQNFQLENLGSENILFTGQTGISNSIDVFDANSTQTTLLNKNTVTFLNDLNNNVTGFDNSNDVVNGQGGDDIINGLSGNDLLRGNAGNDTLIGGAGNDTLIGGAGNNSLDGGIGDDVFSAKGSTGNNTLNGGAGNDTLTAVASTGNNLLFGGDGNDFLDISGADYPDGDYFPSDSRTLGNNTLNGGAGDDTLSASGSKGSNLLLGGDGNDSLTIFGRYSNQYYPTSDSRTLGNNTLNGGAGNDTLSAGGSKGNNLLIGGDGNDYLDITGDYSYYASYDYSDSRPSGNNTLEGGAGDDRLSVSSSTGDNLLSGGDGNDSFDVITNSVDTDLPDLVIQTVDGGNGNDSLFTIYNSTAGGITSTFNATTNTGSITVGMYRVNYNNLEQLNISGTGNNDSIVGSNGNDTLNGGNGNDSLSGGAGTDTFGFYNYNGGIDTIYDFNATNELIQIYGYSFGGGLSIGSLQASQFTIGTSASTSEQRFIYNSTTGALFFDQDGSAAAFSKIQFAQLSAGLSLTNNNFVVV